jgi:hypothetical protein
MDGNNQILPLAGIEDEVEGSLKDCSGKALIPVFYLELHIFEYIQYIFNRML